jgi:preprotein translocase subunit SecG
MKTKIIRAIEILGLLWAVLLLVGLLLMQHNAPSGIREILNR